MADLRVPLQLIFLANVKSHGALIRSLEWKTPHLDHRAHSGESCQLSPCDGKCKKEPPSPFLS